MSEWYSKHTKKDMADRIEDLEAEVRCLSLWAKQEVQLLLKSTIETHKENEIWNKAIIAASSYLSEAASSHSCGCEPRYCTCYRTVEQMEYDAEYILDLIRQPSKGI